MNDLTPKELAVLDSIDANQELRPFFFRKAKGLKWFNALDARGYLDPAGNPAPVPAKEEGYVSVPHWQITDYLVATSPELLVSGNRTYAERVIELIRSVTQRARESEISNYRTWWQFARVIQNIPLDLITPEDISHIDFWMDDPYDRGLITNELGEKWLVALLEEASEDAHDVGLELLRILYKITFVTNSVGSSGRRTAIFRFDKWHAKKLTEAVARRSGRVLGREAVELFKEKLQQVLDVSDNDGWSSLWHPAIEDHEQNRHADDAENVLVFSLRDSLESWSAEDPEESAAFIARMLEGESCTFRRVALHTVRMNYQQLSGLVDGLITECNFGDCMRHEMWHLLHERYPLFPESVRQRVVQIINHIEAKDDNGDPHSERTAYSKSIWLAALKTHSEVLEAQYQECILQAGAAPEHPDFSSYFSGGLVNHESPKSTEELISMGTEGVVDYLQNYEDPGRFLEPGIEGLAKALKAAVKASPLVFVPELDDFADLDNAYVYEVIEAFSELWGENKKLPWDDIWQSLLNFCEQVISRESFWSPENAAEREHFVANRYWVVGSIARLIEAGVKSDEHAFPQELLGQAKGLLLTLLENEAGEQFKPDSDAVSIAINSPRGRCLVALINLALRSCRLANKEGDDHLSVWNDLKPIFEAELARADVDEYEFITLLVNYLPNFLYLSTEWLLENLDRIFDRDNYQKWLCSMQAYSYVNHVYEDIYNYLKSNGHFVYALDDENLNDRVSEKVIQNIVIAYLNDYDKLDDSNSLMRHLIERSMNGELRQLVWFIWTLRKKKDDQVLYLKVMELWPLLLQAIDTGSREGRKLASRLTTWSVFITEVDDTNREMIQKVAAFAEEDYNSRDLLESIARISAAQPMEAVVIWKALLQGSAPDYPEEAIRQSFANIAGSGNEGRRNAIAIADEYIKRGNEKPSQWLQEVIGQ